MLGLRPYTCRACRCRFYRSEEWLEREGPEPIPAEPQPVSAVQSADGNSNFNWKVPLRLLALIAVGAGLAWAIYNFWPGRLRSDRLDPKAAAKDFVFEYEINRPGHDFANFALREPKPELCAVHCSNDVKCRAFTFVKPVVEGASAICWLKLSPGPPQKDACCVSGLKTQ